jgi:hypothetical protein
MWETMTKNIIILLLHIEKHSFKDKGCLYILIKENEQKFSLMRL